MCVPIRWVNHGCYDVTMDAVLTDPGNFSHDSIALWLAQLRASRYRGTLLIVGDVDWCRSTARQFLANADLSSVSWVSNIEQPSLPVVTAKQARELLGQERDAIVFDAHAGFDADAFGAVSGTIVGGGVLLLLCPPLTQWETFADPAAERIAVWPHSFAEVGGRFLRRMVRIISEAPAVTLIEQHAALPILPVPPESQISTEETQGIFRTEDQRVAVAAIEQVMNGPAHCPLVLVADRGRGKTAALGIAAARLLETVSLNIVVTAPRPAAVQPLFERAQKYLPDATVNYHCLLWKDASIQFVAPDLLCSSDVSADLLLVDEAAAIPASLLQQFLARFPRVVFSSTTHGYEGTGRGFAVRFKQTLDIQTPGWSEIKLQEPIRWAQDDPLERLVFDTLLLDATSATDESVAAATLKNVSIEKISRDELTDNELLLSQIFGLLVVAHYRTTPNDLRNLLDGPGLSVYVSRYRGQVVATALVAAEGGFDAKTIESIYVGERRPRGHLLPQSLVAHAGLKTAGSLRCARVMRIAVHPAVQRKGLGRQMLRHIKDDVVKQCVDLLGSSFGATESLLHFWQQENLHPVRLGFRRGHASGEYSVLMLAAMSAAGAQVYAAARRRFNRDLPQWLADPLQALNAEVAICLLQDSENDAERGLPETHNRDMLISFAKGERTYEDALGPLWRLLMMVEEQPPDLAENLAQDVLRAKVLQRQTWAVVADQFKLTGKADVLVRLREGVAQWLALVKTPA